MPIQEVWEIMSEQLYFAHTAYNLKIYSFVLMSNHFHLCALTPNANLSEIMRTFMTETSRQITKSSGRINQTYGQRHFRTVLESHHYYLSSYKYIYYNPVKAGICQKAEEYQFSTLNGLLGQSKILIPIEEDLTLFSDIEGTLQWLNRPPDEEDWNSVKAALRKKTFKLRKDPKTKKPNSLEIDML